jgi:hypothetical protein
MSPSMSQAATLRQQIADGTYRVEPDAVAAAIIARHGARQGLRDLCSEMLVAPQRARRGSGEDDARAGHDAA